MTFLPLQNRLGFEAASNPVVIETNFPVNFFDALIAGFLLLLHERVNALDGGISRFDYSITGSNSLVLE